MPQTISLREGDGRDSRQEAVRQTPLPLHRPQRNTLFRHSGPSPRLETFNFKYGRGGTHGKGEMGFVDSRRVPECHSEAIGIGQYDDDYYCYMTKAGKWGIVGFDGKSV